MFASSIVVEIADKNQKNTIEVVIDRIEIDTSVKERLANAVESGLLLAEGLLSIEFTEIPIKSKEFQFKNEKIHES